MEKRPDKAHACYLISTTYNWRQLFFSIYISFKSPDGACRISRRLTTVCVCMQLNSLGLALCITPPRFFTLCNQFFSFYLFHCGCTAQKEIKTSSFNCKTCITWCAHRAPRKTGASLHLDGVSSIWIIITQHVSIQRARYTRGLSCAVFCEAARAESLRIPLVRRIASHRNVDKYIHSSCECAREHNERLACQGNRGPAPMLMPVSRVQRERKIAISHATLKKHFLLYTLCRTRGGAAAAPSFLWLPN